MRINKERIKEETRETLKAEYHNYTDQELERAISQLESEIAMARADRDRQRQQMYQQELDEARRVARDRDLFF